MKRAGGMDRLEDVDHVPRTDAQRVQTRDQVRQVRLARDLDETEARFLLDGVLSIAGNLGLDVVVEGVERRGQLRTLEMMGSTRAQGFLFGEAVPAEEALGALAATFGAVRTATIGE